MRALTATGFSRSHAFTVVRQPGLPADAPASPVMTLVSLDAEVLIVMLSFHDKSTDQVACSASAGNVTSPCTSRGLLMDTQPYISCAPRQVRRLLSVMSLRTSLQILWLALTSFTAWCSVPCLALVAASRFPRAFERHVVLARLIRSRQSYW